MTATTVEHLLEEVEEEYAFNGVLPLYMFAWSLAGLGHDRSEVDFVDLCRDAYGRFLEHHPEARLVEVPWPIDVGRAKPAPHESDISLDLDPDAAPSTWLHALVRPDQIAS